ncbi:hypothetical protein HZS_2490 [Henneguya salminicola]|nr:hypothetical protein HZS_2490 [Henneguya salminicola]
MICITNFRYTSHNMPTRGIVVANHTTPIDVLVLGSKSFYRFVKIVSNIRLVKSSLGYSHIYRTNSQIWVIYFLRDERLPIVHLLFLGNFRNNIFSIKQHAIDPSLPPVIIFPEGTCINNTSVMQFCKGTFEVCDTVHPVAIKYNPMFGDAFWNSSKESYGWYMINMASSWFVYCDVWFLPPLTKLPNEDAVSFAGRVQKAIAEKANIINLDW